MTRLIALFLGSALLCACQDGASTAGASASGSASATSSADASAQLDVVAPKVGLDGKMPIVQASYSSLKAVFSDDTIDTDAGRIKSQASMVRVSLSDGPMTPGQPMKPGQHLIYFSLTGEKNKAKTPLGPGTYDITSEHFMSIAELRLERAEDDPKRPTILVLTEATGTVQLLEHAGKRVVGKIDVKQGDVHIRGQFSATPMPSGIMRR